MRRALIFGLVLLLAGCAGLPTQINVQTGPELIAPTAQELSFYTPSGPNAGDSPQEIISGFLAAGTGPQNDYSVAREYLTSDFAPRWNPDGGVLLRSGSPVFRNSGGSLQVVDVNIAASVDDQGRYRDFENAETNSLRFQLSQEDGEWRISSAPNLTVVTPPVFAVVFKALSLYFLDSTKNHLISDLRWFPSRTSTGTRLVNALLAGPSDWLSSGVTTAVPENTRLTIDAVRIVDGVAQVDLDANALKADALDRRLMLSQLRNTLLQISGVSDVALSVNNSPQEIVPAPIAVSGSGGSAFAMDADGISRVAIGDSKGVLGSAALVKNQDPNLFAITDSGNRLAVSGPKGIFLSESNGISARVTQLSNVSDISALFFDTERRLWAFPSDADKSILVFDESGNQRELSEGLTGTRIGASIGNEGAKLAIIVRVGLESKVHVLTVIRNSTASPISLNPGLVLKPVVGDPISLIWQESTGIRVLERTSSNLTALSEYPLSGPRRQLTMPPVVGLKLSEGPAALATYLLAEDGGVWALNGTTWRRTTVNGIDISSLR